MMIIVALIALLMAGIGLMVFFYGIKQLNDGEWVVGFWLMVCGLMTAFAFTLACYCMPVKYGLSYASPDTIFKTNGVTVVIYNHSENIYTSRDPKWYWTSNENIQIECKSNTNIWHKTLTPLLRPVVK
jgi:amino acid transporter